MSLYVRGREACVLSTALRLMTLHPGPISQAKIMGLHQPPRKEIVSNLRFLVNIYCCPTAAQKQIPSPDYTWASLGAFKHPPLPDTLILLGGIQGWRNLRSPPGDFRGVANIEQHQANWCSGGPLRLGPPPHPLPSTRPHPRWVRDHPNPSKASRPRKSQDSVYSQAAPLFWPLALKGS